MIYKVFDKKTASGTAIKKIYIKNQRFIRTYMFIIINC